MNKVERVRAALAGSAVDRVPASFWYHFPPDRNRGQASVRAHLEYYREAGLDYLKVMNEHPYQANVTIQSAADWRKVRPAPIRARFYQEQLDELKAILDAVQGECLVITTLFGPFSSGNHASGHQVTEHLKQDAQAVEEGLAAIADSLAEFAAACVGVGASGIYYSAQGGEADRFTQEEFETAIKPNDLTVLRAIARQGEFNLLHVCGERVRLGLYADYPSHAVNWAVSKHDLTLKEGRSLFRRTVVGGMDNRGVIVDGSPDAIRGAVRHLIADSGTLGVILGADCTLPTDIPIGNIRLAVESTQAA